MPRRRTAPELARKSTLSRGRPFWSKSTPEPTVGVTANFTLGFETTPTELTLWVESPPIDGQLPNLLVDDMTVKILSAD
jgi:hypothetical protein